MGRLLRLLLKKLLKKKPGKKPGKNNKSPDKEPGCTTKCKLKVKAKKPAKRHDPCKTSKKDRTKEKNTMIEPGVDIASDIDMLNSGNFVRDGENYKVGDRIYGYHPDTGTVYPKSGPGFVEVDRAQHQLFKKLNTGSYENAMKFAKNMPGLTADKINEVLELWDKCK